MNMTEGVGVKGRGDLLLSGDARWTSVSSGRRVGVTVTASPIGSSGIFGESTSGQGLETPIQYSAARWAWLSFFDYKPGREFRRQATRFLSENPRSHA
jgi:hypothetical protein